MLRGPNCNGRRQDGRYRLATLLTAAGRAPSGDNTQPWRFVVNADDGTIALEEDATRDPSPMNAGGRMSRIALGAALENLIRKARSHGWGVEMERAVYPALAMIRLTREGRQDGPDRRRRAVPTDQPSHFRRATSPRRDHSIGSSRKRPTSEGVRTHWIVGADRLAKLARLIGRADATMFGEASMRRAFLSKVRLDGTPGEEVTDGLSPSSLELSAFDRWALRAIGEPPIDGSSYSVSRASSPPRRGDWSIAHRVSVSSWRGMTAKQTDLLVGRAMQRAWLTLTAEGLAVQPMMSLLVLENVYEHGRTTLVESLGRGTLAALRDEFRALVPEIGGWRPAFLMRFGFAPPPSGRTGRLPLKRSRNSPPYRPRTTLRHGGSWLHRGSKVPHERPHDELPARLPPTKSNRRTNTLKQSERSRNMRSGPATPSRSSPRWT